jgi:hypothetical protein
VRARAGQEVVQQRPAGDLGRAAATRLKRLAAPLP